MVVWSETNDKSWVDIIPNVSSYVNGICTDRYGLPMNVVCNINVFDSSTDGIIGTGSSVSGTGLFSIEIHGKAAGEQVLVVYDYMGTYGDLYNLAGAEYMTTVSGSIL